MTGDFHENEIDEYGWNNGVSDYPTLFDGTDIHVTEKPLQLMRDLVKICVPGGRILDPFCGAGTTVLASRLEGYEAVGIEVTDAYYKLGSDRVRFALEADSEEETSE